MNAKSCSDLPYEVHTGSELDFMLNRGKPLAHFCEAYPPEPVEDVIPRLAFAPHIQTGRIVERLYVEVTPPDPAAPSVRGTLHVLYARPEEQWRIDRYIDMQFEGAVGGWSERLERLQGTLLGYSDTENELHIRRALADPGISNWPWIKRALAARARGIGTSNYALQRTGEG